ncbi:delta-60 repeat domain-containing protein [Dactylosporangium vinaceum]|uniref:Delta-60 repeat domain-containing protein n=1 Tax=Dactylosporangium vinaceum TaxID=53362 RepID=A0ABV5MNQ6_9ACTN|nr:delta-60 repeat domain-containing protein [Dactylosporangium vinaceum]UAB95661.1 delta-60 repeat domain-containing protein [Dactylosporangium vinaceum]
MRRRLIAAAATAIAAFAVAIPASAALNQQAQVSINPVDYTPNVTDGEVRAFALVGDTVVVGGDFNTVTDAAGKVKYNRKNLFAYRASTGEVLPFAPQPDAPVLTLAGGPNNTVYAGGSFKRIAGGDERGLAQLNLADGNRVPAFTAAINWGDSRSVIAQGPWLYVAGSFSAIGATTRTGLARLNATTGAVDPAFDMKLAAPHLSRVKLEDLALTPDGTRLAAVGAVEQAAGQWRAQVVMIDMPNGGPVRLADWYTDAYAHECRAGFETYLRGIDFDPTGTYATIVSTGRKWGDHLMCDTAARFDLRGTGLHKPLWVNWTGGDSLYSVADTGAAVYVGGHQRWMDNPEGKETAGPGAVARPGIAAINPQTGKATDWNPKRNPRGIGARALLATPQGLLVGSDTERIGNEYHGRLALLPVS